MKTVSKPEDKLTEIIQPEGKNEKDFCNEYSHSTVSPTKCTEVLWGLEEVARGSQSFQKIQGQ